MASILNGDLVINVAYVLIFVAAFLLARMFMLERESLAASQNLSDDRGKTSSNGIAKLLRPVYTQYFVPFVRGKPVWDSMRVKYKKLVISAGLREEFSAEEFIAFKLSLIVFFPLALGLAKASGTDLSGIVILGSGAVGWMYPDMWAKGKMEERRKQVLRAMPFIVDLLALSTEAGLDFIGAMGKVVEKAASSPLVDEFQQVLKEIKVGASRSEALRGMGERLDIPEIGSFIAILISSDQMGAPIGKTLRQQSETIRTRRFITAEKAGAAAAQKIMIPIICFVVPAVFIMIFAPTVIQAFFGQGKDVL